MSKFKCQCCGKEVTEKYLPAVSCPECSTFSSPEWMLPVEKKVGMRDNMMTQGEMDALKEARKVIRDVNEWDDLGMRHASKYSEEEYLYAKDVVTLLTEKEL